MDHPIPKKDIEGYRRIHDAIGLPVAMHLDDLPTILRAIKEGVVDCFNLGGSIVQFVRNAAIAEAAGMPCWHGSGNDLGIVETAYLHTASLAPNCTMASDFVGSWIREDDLLVEGLQFEEGYALVPEAPGLGSQRDTVAVERYQQAYEPLSS